MAGQSSAPGKPHLSSVMQETSMSDHNNVYWDPVLGVPQPTLVPAALPSPFPELGVVPAKPAAACPMAWPISETAWLHVQMGWPHVQGPAPPAVQVLGLTQFSGFIQNS